VDSPDGGFWATVGPYLLGGLALLVGVIFASMRDDIRWVKKNLTKVMTSLGIEAD